VACEGTAVSAGPERTPQRYRRFRCRECGTQFNARSSGILNRTKYPSDVIALMVFWRLRYKLSLHDLPEMFLLRGIEFSHETVREWEAKLTPALIEHLRRGRVGRGGSGAPGMSMRPTSRSIVVGATCIGRSIGRVDVRLSESRDMAAAKAFFARGVTGVTPARVTTDGYDMTA
jgi:putative transposase